MVKSMKTLIRLNEWNVDQHRRVLAEFLGQLSELERAPEALEEEVLREQSKAAAMPEEGGFLYGNYAQGVIIRREDLTNRIIEMEHKVAAAREVLNEAYRELKKFEVVEENRIRREREEEERTEQALLDEMGLQTYSRRTAQNSNRRKTV